MLSWIVAVGKVVLWGLCVCAVSIFGFGCVLVLLETHLYLDATEKERIEFVSNDPVLYAILVANWILVGFFVLVWVVWPLVECVDFVACFVGERVRTFIFPNSRRA